MRDAEGHAEAARARAFGGAILGGEGDRQRSLEIEDREGAAARGVVARPRASRARARRPGATASPAAARIALSMASKCSRNGPCTARSSSSTSAARSASAARSGSAAEASARAWTAARFSRSGASFSHASAVDLGVAGEALAEGEVVLAVPGEGRLGRAAARESPRRVLADHGVEREAASARAADAQQRFVGERLERVERGGRRRAEIEHRLGRLDREAADEDRALRERGELHRREQLERPVDGAGEGAVAILGVARARGEHVEAALEALEQRGGIEDAAARGAELDRQREPLEAPHDGRHDRGVARGAAPAGGHRAGALQEELRGGGALGPLVAFAGEGQRLEIEQRLAADAEPLARGREDAELRRALREPRHGRRRRRDELLDVVEDEERRAARAEEPPEVGLRVAVGGPRRERGLQRGGHRGAEVAQRRGLGEIADHRAAGGDVERARRRLGEAQGEPRLADAAGAEHRHQPLAAGEERTQHRELGLAADEARGGLAFACGRHRSDRHTSTPGSPQPVRKLYAASRLRPRLHFSAGGVRQRRHDHHDHHGGELFAAHHRLAAEGERGADVGEDQPDLAARDHPEADREAIDVLASTPSEQTCLPITAATVSASARPRTLRSAKTASSVRSPMTTKKTGARNDEIGATSSSSPCSPRSVNSL